MHKHNVLNIDTIEAIQDWKSRCPRPRAPPRAAHSVVAAPYTVAGAVKILIYIQDTYLCQILLRIDNTKAISYINRMGGVQFPHLTKIAKELWQWCEARNIVGSYIRLADNSVADAES
ncbi:unnamed protein product [Pieris brassicae]|uniref:RNase H type-1 domain-containing protein n=1 Tax=Pieris brassicae TaxID=7116 RepID=A0A9P0T5K6_PIEBR|nr:unnamed protein product [Pieris brassicae]